MEIRNKALCALGKTQKNRPSESRMFSGKGFYEPSFSPLLAPRETLMSRPNVWPWFWLPPWELFCFSKSVGHVSLTFLLSWLLLEYSKSPSDSLREYSLANTQTMLKRVTLSFHGLSSPSVNASWQRAGKGTLEPHDAPTA